MNNEVAAIVALTLAVALGVALDRSAKKRKKAFWEHFGSFEGFRAQVDGTKIQQIRSDHGDVAAIKAVRQSHTYVPLVLAKRYVDELPTPEAITHRP
ncbi:hypothetical protein ACFWAR_34735 [Streptomyces sp. NPDC059917]|uniref:hypothetical protein n=1 Tax=Streptomyces sp. NPDC059917 TaxID=3347002 RepID=UPI0036546EA8